MLEKAWWHNDAQCAVTLTLDDLCYAYVDEAHAGLQASNDWGYGCRRPGSIFAYFEEHVLARYPEIRYTVFLPFGKHAACMVDSPSIGHAGDIYESEEFGCLLQYIVSSGNEIAYHGHHHGRKAPTLDPHTWVDEHEDYTAEEYKARVAADVERIRRELGIQVQGGRSPGYRYGPVSEAAIFSGLFKWWSFDFTEFQCPLGYRQDVWALPTNVSGGTFTARGRVLREFIYHVRAEMRLRRMIRERNLLTVTEHFMSARPDGKRQGPGVYDDTASLDRIFELFRGTDAWYATCSEVARYRQAYDFTELAARDDETWEARYTGSWKGPITLSLVGDVPALRRADTGEVLRGADKSGRWVFNAVAPGTYRRA